MPFSVVRILLADRLVCYYLHGWRELDMNLVCAQALNLLVDNYKMLFPRHGEPKDYGICMCLWAMFYSITHRSQRMQVSWGASLHLGEEALDL